MIHKTNIFAAPIICGAALALALAAGCDKMATTESPTGFPEDGVVRIAANAGDPLTRGDGTSSSEYSGTTLGLFIDYGTGDKYNGSNVKWTKAENAWSPEKQMLWKDDKTGANIYAYAPYVDGSAADAVNFEIPSDQTAGTLTADLVSWAYLKFVPNSSNNNFQDGKILISFGHRLVKLTFNFEKGNQFASDVTVSEAVLLGTSSKVVLNATNGSVTAASDAAGLDIKLHKVEDAQNPNALKYEAVFFPGEGQKAGVKMLKVTMSEGTVLNYVVPSDGLVEGGLKAGSAYEMKMRLGKDKIEVASDVTVADWTEGGTTLPGGEAQLNGNSWDGTIATGFEGGDGSSNDPYIIATASQLAYLAQQVNGGESYRGKNFNLTQDLILNSKAWTPIGNKYNNNGEKFPFSGNFEGGGHTVHGLKLDLKSTYAGLFGVLDGGTVQNVNIVDAEVQTTGSYAGGICGYAFGNAKISNCEVSGRVIAGSMKAGGIVGELVKSDGKTPTMQSCKAEVEVKGSSNVGGLCGTVSGAVISNCHVIDGMVYGTSAQYLGGIAGLVEWSTTTIKDCTVDASVVGRIYVGGLFGAITLEQTKEEPHSVEKCTMTGTVKVTNSGEKCGGLVGYLSKKGTLKECGFNGTIVKEDEKVKNIGAALGFDESDVTFTDCWYNADKTEGLAVVGKGKDGKDYSGIEEKHLGK